MKKEKSIMGSKEESNQNKATSFSEWKEILKTPSIIEQIKNIDLKPTNKSCTYTIESDDLSNKKFELKIYKFLLLIFKYPLLAEFYLFFETIIEINENIYL